MKKFCSEILRYAAIVVGFAIMALGLTFLVNAQLGLPPWDVLHMGLSQHFPLSYGQVIQVIGLLCIAAGYLMKIKPSLATFLNMFFVGFWVDLYLDNHIIPEAGHLSIQFLYLVSGILIFAYGTAIYMSFNRGTGPRDSLMMGLTRITGRRMGAVRTSIEVTVTLGGVMLGGPLGIGTLVVALTVGFCLEGAFQLIRWQLYVGERFLHWLSVQTGLKLQKSKSALGEPYSK